MHAFRSSKSATTSRSLSQKNNFYNINIQWMMYRYTLATLTFILVICSHGMAQTDAEYKKRVEEVKKEVWGWNIPAFSNRTIPAAMANEPGVVIARRQEIKALSKTKVKFLVITAAKYKEIYFTNTYREMVKINDKATLDEFSEFSYQKSKSFAKFFSKTIKGQVTVLGIRIIKPDGTVKEVNVDEEVMIKNEKDEKKSKVAVSGLEVGDIIDYFVSRQEDERTWSKTEPYLFVFGDDKPILHYSVHCEVGPTCAVEYRAMNGAPEFTVKRDADGGNMLDVEYRNIAKAPVDLWMSPARQLPILRLSIRIGELKGTKRKEGEVYRNQPYQQIITDVKTDMWGDFFESNLGIVAEVLASDIKSMIKRARKQDDLPKDSLPYYIYYAFRYIAFYKVDAKDKINVGLERNYQVPDKKKFLLLLSLILKKHHIDNEIILATSVYGPDTKQAMLADDFEYIIKTTKNDPVYMCTDGVFTNCNYIPAEYEGQEDPTVVVKSFNKTSMKMDNEALQTIGRSSAKNNVQTENLKVSVSDNMEDLKINRTTVLKGQMRRGTQRYLLLFEDYYKEERKALAIKESFMEEFADSRKNRSLADEYTAAFAKARSEWKDRFISEITDEFDIKPKEVTQYKINNMGLRHTKPDFIYSTQFTVEGWVKRGGNNYIIDIGKLIGGQLQLKPAQLERSVDVYMPCSRTFEYNISFEIPQGYKAEGLDKLVINAANETGSFISEAKQEGNILKLKIARVYTNAFEPAGKWPRLVEIINAVNDFQNKKILLRKG